MDKFMEVVKNIASIIGCALALVSFVGIIVKPIREAVIRKFTRKQESDNLLKRFDDIDLKFDGICDRMSELGKEIKANSDSREEIVLSLKEEIKSSNDACMESLKTVKEDIRINNDGTLNSLRYQLYGITERILQRGYLIEKERELILDLYNAYKALGGDSYISDRVDRVLRMETK